MSVIDLEAGLSGKQIKSMSQVSQGVDVVKHFTSEMPVSDGADTARICICPFVIFLCVLTASIGCTFHSSPNVLINFVEFGFVRGGPRIDFDDNKRINTRGNIVVGQMFKQRCGIL
jgi:hypothetical protein